MTVQQYVPKKLSPILVERGYGTLSEADAQLSTAIWDFLRTPEAYTEGGVAYEWAKQALEAGANPDLLLWPNKIDDLGHANTDTVLHMAASCGHADMVRLLIENNANVDVLNHYAQTPLILAFKNGANNVHAEAQSHALLCAFELLNHNADVNKGGRKSIGDPAFNGLNIPTESALHHAVSVRPENKEVGKMLLRMVKRLVDAGADINVIASEYTPLQHANHFGGDENVKMYLELCQLEYVLKKITADEQGEKYGDTAKYIAEDLKRRITTGKDFSGFENRVDLDCLKLDVSILEAMRNAEATNIQAFASAAQLLPKNMAATFAEANMR